MTMMPKEGSKDSYVTKQTFESLGSKMLKPHSSVPYTAVYLIALISRDLQINKKTHQ